MHASNTFDWHLSPSVTWRPRPSTGCSRGVSQAMGRRERDS